MKIRRAQAAVDFGRQGVGLPVIPTNNTAAIVQQLIDELDVSSTGDATERVVNSAEAMRKTLLDEEATPSAHRRQAQRLLQIGASRR